MIINADLPEGGRKPSPIYRQSVEQTQYCKLLQSSIAIFQKPYEHRTAIQVAMISKLVQKVNLFKAVEITASTDTVKSLIKFGKIVRLTQHQLVCEETASLDCFLVALVGKFGSVSATSESITIPKDEQAYAHYLNDFKNFTPKHLQFLKKKQLRLPKPFKPPKVNPSQFDIRTSLQASLDNELLFTGQHQFLTPLQVKKYPQTIITLAQENYLFEIDFKKLCELMREEHAKALLKQVQIFSSFDCFKLFKKQKLKQMVEELHILKLKKDQLLFSQGQPDRRIFILTKGQISLERFAALGHQNPNNLYKNRLSIKRSEHKNRTRDKISPIPFADFSKVYNASTELKKVKLTILSPISIFGEEEVIAQTERETTAKVTSYGAEMYVFTVEQISRYFAADSQYKVGDFLQVLGQEITEKKILYRQEKFGGEVDYLNRNSKNGFYITEDLKTSPKGKRAITNINKTIPVRVQPKWVEEEEDSKMFLTATFNCHNFQEFYESRKAKKQSKIATIITVSSQIAAEANATISAGKVDSEIVARE